MKILYLVDSLGLGGVQTLLKCHFENQQNNENIFVYALRNCKSNIEIRHKNITINKSKSKYSLYPILSIKSFIKKNRIDVLHCNLFRSLVFGWVIKVLFYPKIKLVYHEHGPIFDSETNSKIFNYLYRKFLSFAQYKIDKFIANSMATRKRLITLAKIDAQKITIIYSGLDLNVYTPKNKIDSIVIENRKKLGFSPNDFVVSFAGRIIERKGWKILLKAAITLRNKPRFKFLVAGDGAEKDLLLNFINKNNLNNSVVYYGFYPDIISFYLLSDCFVIPSHWEPLGLVGIEAQALKIPLIAADVEALNEIITDNSDGLLFNISNAEDLANKIEYLESNIELKEKLINNGIVNAKKYSIDNYIKNIEQLYHGKL